MTDPKLEAAAREYADTLVHRDSKVSRRIMYAAFRTGYYQGLEAAAKVCDEQVKAYNTDIFPDYSLANGDKPSNDAVAGKMGRFLCDVLAREIRALASEGGSDGREEKISSTAIFHAGCNYYALRGTVCNKCGKIAK